MIPPKQVQDILDVVRIEEVIEDFVTLRRRGVNLIGLCPFHGEKTPSFNVNPTRNIFKCFGCGKGGDAITFLREHEHLTYVDALRWVFDPAQAAAVRQLGAAAHADVEQRFSPRSHALHLLRVMDEVLAPAGLR